MARLPSGQTVPSVSPARDPGLSVPEGAFDTTSGIAARELLPGLDELSQAALRQQNRADTVDRSSKINQFNRDADEELRRLNVESDLSSEDVLLEYGKFLTNRKRELLGNHGGSNDSAAVLEILLGNIEGEYHGRAGAVSASIGREKVRTTFNSALDPIIGRVAPSREGIDEAFLDLETLIDDLRGAFDPNEEQALRAAGQEAIALGALDTLLARGRVEQASVMLESGGLSAALSADKDREMRNKIETVRFAKTETLRKLTEAETVLGRPFTPQERERFVLGQMGLDSEMSEKQRQIASIVGRGFSQATAEDIVFGRVRVHGPDDFGNFVKHNILTGETEILPVEETKLLQEMAQNAQGGAGQEATTQPEAQPQKSQEPSLEDSVAEGTGPFAAIRAGVSNIIGPFVEGTVQQDTTDARQQLRIFRQFAKAAIVNNPRFPVAEQKLVDALLPDPDRTFIDPDTARSNFVKLRGELEKSVASKSKEMTKRGLTTSRRADLSDQVSRLNEVLTLMETPESEALPEGVPEGSTLEGRKSSRGNDVYRTPDGKLLEVVP